LWGSIDYYYCHNEFGELVGLMDLDLDLGWVGRWWWHGWRGVALMFVAWYCFRLGVFGMVLLTPSSYSATALGLLYGCQSKPIFID
jgi:hypothetical protein